MNRFIHINRFKKLLILLIFAAVIFAFSQNEQKGLLSVSPAILKCPVLIFWYTIIPLPKVTRVASKLFNMTTVWHKRRSPSQSLTRPVAANTSVRCGYKAVGVSPQEVGLTSRIVDRENNEISMPCSYPDTSRSRQGFNPIIYPDLQIKYTVKVKAQANPFQLLLILISLFQRNGLDVSDIFLSYSR